MSADFVFEPDRLRSRLSRAPRPCGGAGTLAPYALPGGPLTRFEEAELKSSAVLVPILYHADGPRLLMTRRAEALRNHSGQVSFPGGRRDPEDVDLQATALREAHEEVGLKPEYVELLGFLDDVCTFSGYLISPVVGLVRLPFEAKFEAGEVAEVFELPLPAILASDAFSQKQEVLNDHLACYWEMNHEPQRIWGATAAILLNLRFQLEADG